MTRSLRRAGRQPTGVDRVERAYLTHLMTSDVPLFGLVRTAFGYVLLGPDGAERFHDRLEGRQAWPKPDILSRLPQRRDVEVVRAETLVRQEALARCLPYHLSKMLSRHFSKGFAYFNVGHSNLTDRVFEAVHAAGGESHVFVHDVIPLEHRAFQRPGTVELFRSKLQRVSRHSDRVIYNSEDTRRRAEMRMSAWGRVPPCTVAHLGSVPQLPDIDQLPPHLPPDRPYFVALGTIEPRKNHGFLLDLWEDMGAAAPPLLICGSRGWNNEAVFDRLDSLPDNSPIKELRNLSDPAIAALLENSAGLLFPSHAEGFGLPAIEALALGTRVLCNDLPVFHEVLGSFANIVPVADSKSWLQTLKKWETERSPANKAQRFAAPNWADHLNTVLRLR